MKNKVRNAIKKRNSRKNIALWYLCLLSIGLIGVATIIGSNGGGGGGKSEGGGDEPAAVKQINTYHDAISIEEKVAALQNIAGSCASLSVLDIEGNQLNPDAKSSDITLSTRDMDYFSWFIEEGEFRTLGEVIEFLEDFGVILVETDAVITFDDVQATIQEYVDWSFDNKDNPDSTLGLLIAAGPDLKIPDTAPTITSDTQVSPMTAILILADILVGVDDPPEGYASANLSQPMNTESAAKKVQGFLTLASKFDAVILAILSEEERTNYDLAKNLIGKFALGGHIEVGFFGQAGKTGKPEVLSTIELKAAPKNVSVGIIIVPTAEFSSDVIDNVSADYTLLFTEVRASGDKQDAVDYDLVFGDGNDYLEFKSTLSRKKSVTVKTNKTPNVSGTARLQGEAILNFPDLNIDELIDEAQKKLDEKRKKAKLKDYPSIIAGETLLGMFKKDKELHNALTTLASTIKASFGEVKVNIDAKPDELSVAITADPQNTFVDDWVFFNSSVSGGRPPYLYEWDFGDGGSSTLHDDTHRYSKRGFFDVTLTVTDADDNEASDYLQVNVDIPETEQYFLVKRSGTGYRKKWGGWAEKRTGYDYHYWYILPKDFNKKLADANKFAEFTDNACWWEDSEGNQSPTSLPLCPCTTYPDIWEEGKVELVGMFENWEEMDPYRCDTYQFDPSNIICTQWVVESDKKYWNNIDSICGY